MELPIHPMMVHFPIAFYLLEILLLSLWLFKKEETYCGFSRFVFSAAFIGMGAALLSGWLEVGGWKNIQGETAEHFYGAVAVGVIQTLRALYWYFGKPSGSKGATICLLSAIAGCAALIYTAYHGGELVYGKD